MQWCSCLWPLVPIMVDPVVLQEALALLRMTLALLVPLAVLPVVLLTVVIGTLMQMYW